MTAMPPFVQERPRFIHEPYELSVNQVLTMGQQGILGPKDHVELIAGSLLLQPMHNLPHILVLAIISRWLYRLLPDDWLVISQATVHLNDATPEPDLAIANGPAHRYHGHLIAAHDLHMVVEVADTTFRFDVTTKQELYARNGIAVYWLISIPAQQVHVFTTPNTVAERYENETIYHVGDNVPLVLAGGVVGAISVASLFPPGEGA